MFGFRFLSFLRASKNKKEREGDEKRREDFLKDQKGFGLGVFLLHFPSGSLFLCGFYSVNCVRYLKMNK